MHIRQCQTNNITLYALKFRVHATTKMNYVCVQNRYYCLQNNNMRSPSLHYFVGLRMLLLLHAIIPCLHALVLSILR